MISSHFFLALPVHLEVGWGHQAGVGLNERRGLPGPEKFCFPNLPAATRSPLLALGETASCLSGENAARETRQKSKVTGRRDDLTSFREKEMPKRQQFLNK